MARFYVAVMGAVLLAACGGGEDPRDLTQEQTTTGAVVQSGTVGEEGPKERVPNKNTDSTIPGTRAAQE
jgi:hypothetical protein